MLGLSNMNLWNNVWSNIILICLTQTQGFHPSWCQTGRSVCRRCPAPFCHRSPRFPDTSCVLCRRNRRSERPDTQQLQPFLPQWLCGSYHSLPAHRAPELTECSEGHGPPSCDLQTTISVWPQQRIGLWMKASASPVTINPSGASCCVCHKHRGLSWRLDAMVIGRPTLIGGVAMKNGLTTSDVTVRVGGAMAVVIRYQEVIIHWGPAERKMETIVCLSTTSLKLSLYN